MFPVIFNGPDATEVSPKPISPNPEESYRPVAIFTSNAEAVLGYIRPWLAAIPNWDESRHPLKVWTVVTTGGNGEDPNPMSKGYF